MRIENSTILITGGTGSFGNRVATELLRYNPKQIRIYSRDEKKQWEMSNDFPGFRYMIGDVRDPSRLREALRGVDIVFHAAALKQVPSCESYPWEAIKTNTIGSQNVCEAAIAAGVKCVVALSTDKAVKPVNAMGMSKAMMEKIVVSQNLVDCDTVFCCVRYGNVMGSRGSVIPLFRRKIEQELPLTLTVPHMTRFLLTLDQSVDLVLHAMTHAQGGEIFVRKAPACTVLDLARVMAKKYSKISSDHPIEVIGIRPGEKIHEVLVNEYEVLRSTEDATYYTIYPEYRGPGGKASETKASETKASEVKVPAEPLGWEYTSENTRQLTSYDAISTLLDAVGKVEYFI
jgi:UDP-N-acetylglucosamine 4,6-dehydratase/5-epimerase